MSTDIPSEGKPERHPVYKFFANGFVQGVAVFIALAVAFSGKLDSKGTLVAVLVAGTIGTIGIYAHCSKTMRQRIVATFLILVYGCVLFAFYSYLTSKPPAKTDAKPIEISKNASADPKPITEQPHPSDTAAPLVTKSPSKKPAPRRELEKMQPIPPQNDHAAVRIEKGAKWISTDDTVYAPNGTGIENKGEITSKSLRVITPQTSSPIQNCPNGVCIGGDNSGTATVNNFGPPPAKIATWDQKAANWQEKDVLVPEKQVTLTVDHLMEIPAFSLSATVLAEYERLSYSELITSWII